MKRFKLLSVLCALTLILGMFTGCTTETETPEETGNTTNQEVKNETGNETNKVKYPTKSIQVIVPAGAGGDTDMNARLFGKYLEKELGQPVVIVNTKGGGGTVGSRKVKDAEPDGHTVLFFHPEILIPYVAGLVDYNIDAFEVAGIGVIDNTTVLATHKNSSFKNLDELVEEAKANPGQVEFGMQTGGYAHIIGLALEDEMGVDFNFVDIGGNAAKTVALKGEKTGFINTQYGLTKDYFTSGDFVNLGLLSPERNPLMPDLPTAAEQGYDINFNKFFFYAMPKGTDKAIVDKFSAAMKKVVENVEYQAEAEKIFVTPTYMNSEEATTYIKGYLNNFMKYQDLFKASMNQ